MPTWKQALKRGTLGIAAVVVAFAWSNTGRAQSAAPCLVERGQDPLDILNSNVRHNVWLMLDTSGSMNETPTGESSTKLQLAQRAINRLMDTLVDAAGRPLVNWGFVPYGVQPRRTGNKCPAVPPDSNLDTYPDTPDGCTGLSDESFVNPGTCAIDSRADVRLVLDGVLAQGGTPIGVAFTDIASYIAGDSLTAGNTTSFIENLLPTQKNFIIHITDGVDTCECEAGGYTGMSGDPLPVDPVVTMRPDISEPNATVTSTEGGDRASFNAGLKGEVALRTIDPLLDGSKGNVFVVGFGIEDPTERSRISTIAWMSSGANLVPQRDRQLMNEAFFAGAREDDLVRTMEDILARIGVPDTEVTLGAPVVASVKEVVATATNPALAPSAVIPLDTSDGEEIREARVVRSNHRNNVQFTTSVEIPSFRGHLRATNIYSVTNPDDPRNAREADFTELWDAGVELQDDDPDDRPLLFNRRGSTDLLPFDVDNVLPEDLGVTAGYLQEADGRGALTAEDARDIVVQIVRGYRLSVDPATGFIYDSNGDLNFSELEENGEPTWKLWESTAGAVGVALNPPRSPDFDPPLNHAFEYGVGGSVAGDGFYWDNINRRTLVLYAANPGMLHAFDAGTGREVWGFIPDDAVGLDPLEVPGSRDTLKDFVRLVVLDNNGVPNHKFMLSSPPVVADAFLRADRGGDDAWHTLVGFGRGRGGRFLTTLDITDATTSGANLRLLWNVGNREGVFDGELDGLGETWSIPSFGNVDTRSDPSQTDDRVDQWLMFAGGGYGCVGEEEGEFLFAFRAEDGALYFQAQASDAPDAAIAKNGFPASPTLYNPHTEDSGDNRDFVTRVYIPDLHGQVWKLDTSDIDPGQWTFNVFASMGGAHPIVAAVSIVPDTFQPNRVFVMAGSGGDRRAPVPPDGFKFVTWIDEDPPGANTTQFGPSDAPAFQRFLNEGERMFVQAVTAGRIGDSLPANVPAIVFFAGSRENFDESTCQVTFNSTLYALGIESGQPEFDLDSTQTGEDSADLGEGRFQGGTMRDGRFTFNMSGGLGVSGRTETWGDGDFEQEPSPSGFGQFTLRLLVDGFRISPF